ncbi:MAG TPA: hypothetical protein VH741_09145 [Candidatus Limnocylindrales bacterium]
MRQSADRSGFRTEPPSAPPTTRIGSGLSARIVALAAVIVLAGVAWIGVSNRPAKTPDSARPSFPIAQATPPPTEPPSRPAPTPLSTAIAFPGYGDPGAPIALLGYDATAAIAQIEGRTYMGLLRADAAGHLVTAFRVPFLEWTETASIEIAQLWTRDEALRNYIPLGRWPIELAALRPEMARASTLLRREVTVRQRPAALPRDFRRGFSVTVKADTAGSFGVLLVDVELSRGHILRGDDSRWLERSGQIPGPPSGRIELQLLSYQLVVERTELADADGLLAGRLAVPPTTWLAPAWLQLRWVDGAGLASQQLATVALSLGSPDSIGLPIELARGTALLPETLGATRHWDYAIQLERASPFSSPVEWVAAVTLTAAEPALGGAATPPVPLILLTAQPWNTTRANRTHGESWVGGY